MNVHRLWHKQLVQSGCEYGSEAERVIAVLKAGLISVTFRKLSPEQIIGLVKGARLQAIEWGGDIHVPHGEIALAAEVGRMTREAGLEVASYGSYYRLAASGSALQFDEVLATAIALQAPAIRVWAGDRSSAETSEEQRQEIVADAKRIAGLAQEHGIKVDFEYHSGTLTDCTESAVRLLVEIGSPNIRCNWQVPVNMATDAALAALGAISPWLANVHVFHWTPGSERKALVEGKQEWMRYIAFIHLGKTPTLMLEFVKDDAPEQFLEDAKVLLELMSGFTSSANCKTCI